jgi:DNA-binding NtrC family response regulator
MLRRTLELRGYSVEEAADAYEARRRIEAERLLVVLTDLRLPAGDGFEVLRAAKDVDPDMPVIVMTAFGSIEDAVRAMKEGAADFLTKPVDTDHLLVLLERAIGRRRLHAELVLLREEHQRRFGLPRVLGEDPGLRETLLAVQRAATSDATVLFLGESGTGKELMARSLHQLSARAGAPFVAINCAAIPEALLENELFGHEKGAFTGASQRKLGKVELADRGTLFLDEIGDLSLPLQSKILRLVQERQFERVGGLRTLGVNLRVVAATNRDLRGAVERREFREDLFFRLAVLVIEIPPLRRRRGDVLRLAESFLERSARELGRRGLRFSEAAQQALLRHNWPGNVRELQNCVERATILADAGGIEPEHLVLGSSAGGPTLRDVLDLSGTLEELRTRALERVEREAVGLALEEAGGDRAAAARRLGLSPSALARRLRAEDGTSEA